LGCLRNFRKDVIMFNYIPVNEPLLNGNEKRNLIECIDSGWISSEGPFIKEFEEKFAARMGRKHGIAVSNGSVAIDAVIEALGIGEGDEVIMPTFTIISCVAQIVRNGGVPVLIDSDPDTWNMDINQIESSITPRTKAIMIVHIYGLPVDVDPVLDIAKRHGLKVIEDAAEMHGQDYKGRPCGSFGDISTFSFYPNKHITTGEGGMILTDDDELAENCRMLRNLCFQASKRFVHDQLGWNFRMTNLQAAIGLAQLERLDEFVIRKRNMGALYNSLLSDIKELRLPIKETVYANNIYWVYGVLLNENCGYDAQTIMDKLNKEGVGTRPFFYPMHRQPVLLNKNIIKPQSLPVSEGLYKQGFYIPSGMALSTEQIHTVASKLIRVLS
jgi:perosamine synthetase